MFVSNLFKRCSFQINDNLDLVNLLGFECLLTALEFVTPGVFHFFNDPLCDIFWVCCLKKFHKLNLASIDDHNWPALFVSLMETNRHELSDGIFFPHEVMLKKQVDLHLLSPSSVFNKGLESNFLIEFCCN